MSKFLIRAALVVLAVAADIAIPQIRSATPDFVFLLVVFYAFRENSEVYLGVALVGGILLDTYASSAFGSYAIGLLLIGLLIRLATGTLFRSEPRSFAYMTVAIVTANIFLIAFLYLFNTIAMHWQNGLQNLSPLYITHSVWLVLILNLLFAIPVYAIVEFAEMLVERYNRPQHIIR
jgi:rod shape-determining protein MreD